MDIRQVHSAPARLHEENLLEILFVLGFVLVIAAIVGSSLKSRPGRREIGDILGVAAVYGMAVVRMGVTPEERSHHFEYGMVAIFIHQALCERKKTAARFWCGCDGAPVR